MTAAPPVSIVLPVHRAAAFLPRAVEQVVALDYPALEIVIVDDGSGDDTAEVARALTADDDRFRLVELPVNGGVARARRAGVEAATGEYVWFVDADDAWSPDALRTLVGMATAREADVVVAAATLVTRGGERRPLVPPVSPPVNGRAAFRMLLRGEITGHLWNKLFRRETLLRAAFAPARVQSDLALVADALGHATAVAFTGIPIYDYLLRDGSIITSVRQRADSLALIDETVTSTARRLGLHDADDLVHFRARYIALSGIKDALRAEYLLSERKVLVSRNRRMLGLAEMAVFLRRRDVRRALLTLTAKSSTRAHRALLTIADG